MTPAPPPGAAGLGTTPGPAAGTAPRRRGPFGALAGPGVAGQTMVILLSRIVGAVSTGVLTVVLARLLGLEGYGTYAFALTIAGIAALVASLGLDSATSRFVAENHNERRGVATVILRGLWLRLGVGAVVFAPLVVFPDAFGRLLGQEGMGPAIRAAAIALFFSAGFQWVSGVYEGVRRGERLALMSVVKAVVEFGLVLALLLSGYGVVAALLGNAAGYAACVGVGLLLMRPYLRRSPERPERAVSAGSILRYGNHIWLAGVAWILFDRVDQLLLGAFIGTEAVGLYEAPWRIATILGLLALSIASSVTPRVASSDRRTAGELLTKALRVSIVFYVVVACVTAVAATDIVVTLLGAEFARSADVLRVLLPYLALIGLAPIVSRALDFIGVASVRKWIALATFLVNLALDLVLIPTVGLLGPAIATNVAILVFVGGHYMVCARRMDIDGSALARTLGRSLVAAAVASLGCALGLLAPGPGLVRLAVGIVLGIVAGAATLLALREVDPREVPVLSRLASRLGGRGRPRGEAAGPLRIPPIAVLPLALATTAAVIGGLIGRSPMLVLGGVVALALVALLLSDITVGTIAFVVIQPLVAAAAVGAAGELLAKALGAILFVTWLVSLRYPSLRRRYGSLVADHPFLVGALIAFAGWAVASTLWSVDRALAIEDLQRWGLSLVLLGIVFTAARNRRSVVLICGGFAVSALLSTVAGLATGQMPEGRLAGTLGDPNEFAAFCVPALLIAGALAATARTLPARVGFAGIGLVCTLGIVLSGSRGGIIALLAAFGAWVLFGGRWRMRVVAAGAIVAVVLVGYLNTFADPATRDRILVLTEQEQIAADGGTGRTDIWEVGRRAFGDRPIAGAGVGNYTEATPRYLTEPGLVRRSDLIIETPKVAHNLYLHVLVELGVVGMALLGLALLAVIAAALRAAHGFLRAGDAQMELLSRAVLAGFIGLLAADVFISGQYQRELWILAGLAVALGSLARGRRRAAAPAVPPEPPGARRRPREPEPAGAG